MDIAIEIPAGQKFEPGVHVKVRIDDGEPQDQVVQSASYRSGDLSGRYLASLPGQPNVWNKPEPSAPGVVVSIGLDQ
jgi:hypothetical protein